MSAPALTPATQQGHDYLAAVERELDDLPAEERTALVEDLALHLEAVATEDDDRPIAVRLGPPAAYAADLRSAAGLPARTGALASATGLRERLARVRTTPAVREVLRLLRELRPAWWVLRGYLVVLVPSVAQVDGQRDFPVPSPLGSPALGALLVVLAVFASVLLGRRALPRAVRVLVAVGGLVLVLLALAIGVAANHSWAENSEVYPLAYQPEYERAMGEYPLLSRSGPVTDVFPYAADGTPLEGVLLYDQDGRPLQVGYQEWWADECVRVLEQPRAADGVPVPNSFPQSYELLPSLDVDIHGAPLPPGQCTTELPRPDVPLPTFPAGSTAPAPGD